MNCRPVELSRTPRCGLQIPLVQHRFQRRQRQDEPFIAVRRSLPTSSKSGGYEIRTREGGTQPAFQPGGCLRRPLHPHSAARQATPTYVLGERPRTSAIETPVETHVELLGRRRSELRGEGDWFPRWFLLVLTYDDNEV